MCQNLTEDSKQDSNILVLPSSSKAWGTYIDLASIPSTLSFRHVVSQDDVAMPGDISLKLRRRKHPSGFWPPDRLRSDSAVNHQLSLILRTLATFPT